MSRALAALPPGYEALLQGAGLHDVVICAGAKVAMMEGSEAQRAGMNEVVHRLAADGADRLPHRMLRIPRAWYPGEHARPRAQITALTPPDASAYGLACQAGHRNVFFITAIELLDASNADARGVWKAAGDEAVRLTTWLDQNGTSHGAVSKTR